MNAKGFVLTLTVLMAIVMLSSTSCLAQDQAISIAGVTLKIGMPQPVVLEKLMEYAKVEKAQDASVYFISERGGDSQRVIGSVSFVNGRLGAAQKNWYNGLTQRGYETAELLNSILAQLEQKGLTVASISTRVTREPGFAVSSTVLRFAGNLRLSIYVTQESGEDKRLEITESISAK